MKKLLIGSAICLCLFGCGNKDYLDFNKNTFRKAIVTMSDGTHTELDIVSWSYYYGEQIQVTTEDGIMYLLSSYNCTLVSE